MKYIIIEDYLKEPLKIYDGGEPRRIIFNIRAGMKKSFCKIDLWNAISNWGLRIENKSELDEINKALKLPKSKFMDEEIIVTRIIEKNEESVLRFSWCSEKKEYVVVYSLFEKNPSRYQCYVLAVLKKGHNSSLT